MAYKTLLVDETDGVVFVTLNRHDVHNAFNDELISEAIDLFGSLSRVIPSEQSESRDPHRIGGDPSTSLGMTQLRAVVLRSGGPNFCAGADLNWMSRMVAYTRDDNIRDSSQLAKMFALMNECPLPIIGRIQGAAIGGGVGLVSVCDIAIATRDAKFGLSEVKLGILPAVISPYLIAKIGESHARALFLTGERFDADRALRIGLVHRVVDDADSLDAAVNDTLSQLMSSGPEAVRACKRLIAYVAAHPLDDSIPYTIEAIAERRVSPEGQQGMNAFLRKEKAPWAKG
jgi:methylglutaconyl-CoA hydratase